MSSSEVTDSHLTKQIKKMFNRIEKILNPSDSVTFNDCGSRLEILMRKVQRGLFYRDACATIKKLHTGRKVVVKAEPTLEGTFSERVVIWDSLETEIINAISNHKEGFVLPSKVREEIDTERRIQDDTVAKLKLKDKLSSLQVSYYIK